MIRTPAWTQTPQWVRGLLVVFSTCGYVLLASAACPLFGGDDDDNGTDTAGDTAGTDTGSADTRIAVDCCQIPEGADCSKAKNDGIDCCVGGNACGPQGRCTLGDGGACTTDAGCNSGLKCVGGACTPTSCQTAIDSACNPNAGADNVTTGQCCPGGTTCTAEAGLTPTCRIVKGAACTIGNDGRHACGPGLECAGNICSEPASFVSTTVSLFNSIFSTSLQTGISSGFALSVGEGPCTTDLRFGDGGNVCPANTKCGGSVDRRASGDEAPTTTVIPWCVGDIGAFCFGGTDVRGDDSPLCDSDLYCVRGQCVLVDETANPPMAYISTDDFSKKTNGVEYTGPQVYGPKATPWGQPEPVNTDPIPVPTRFFNPVSTVGVIASMTAQPDVQPVTLLTGNTQPRTNVQNRNRTGRLQGVAPREMPGTTLQLHAIGPKAATGTSTPKVNCPPNDPQYATYTQQCGEKCIPSGAVCCEGGQDFCAAGALCVTDGEGNPACYDSTQPATCDIDQDQCGLGCMPKGAQCCDDNKSFCREGKTCQPGGGCCPKEGCATSCLDGWEACGTGCMPKGSKCCSNGGYCYNPPFTCSDDGTRCVLDKAWAEQWLRDQIEVVTTTTPQVISSENCVKDTANIGNNEICSGLTVDPTGGKVTAECTTKIKIPDGTTITCNTSSSCEPSNTSMQCCAIKAMDQYLNDPTTPKDVKDRLRTERAKYKLSTEK